ncbi:condensation protein [Streptomyces sp. NPDC018031]|uniref:condensation protein n=1 Tax=Streptomyces sp. NPDC018031 TaxID=3365033 RepID=UPI0037A4017E
MTTLHDPRLGGPAPATGAGRLPRVPFPTIDEVSRHCVQDEEPETVHIEVHLPGRPDPDRLRAAFHEALRKHPRILMRQAPGAWWRRRYEWELTDGPDVDPVSFPPPAADALDRARERSMAQCPPLDAAPPIRLEQVVTPGEPGCVLVLTINHTALDGPSCLRILATAATLYGGAENPPAPPPSRAAAGAPAAPAERAGRTAADVARSLTRSARIAADTRAPGRTGNGMLLLDLPVPARWPAPADGSVRPTVNDQLMVAVCLTAARWNRLHGRPAAPVRVTMPIDDRPRAAEMPIGNGTRLVDVDFAALREADPRLLAAEHPDPAAVARLVHRTAAVTRALKATPAAPMRTAGTLLTAPVLPVGLRAALTRTARRVAGPWTSTVLLSNIGRVAFPLDFGDAGRARAVWFSAPARMPRGLAVTCASTAGRLHLTLRWSRALLDDAGGAALAGLLTRSLALASPGNGPATAGGERPGPPPETGGTADPVPRKGGGT